MPDLKEKGLTMLANQTPRVLIAIITIGALVGMAWFEKLTDVLAGCITVVGSVAQWANFKILAMSKKPERKV